MKVEDILKAFSHTEHKLPREALEQAAALKDEITPWLLKILERLADNPEEGLILLNQEDYSHYYALYLLAQFRETRAYPLVIRIASLPPITVYELLGQWLTEALPRILASVCGGDASLLERLAENTEAKKLVRGSAICALLALTLSGDKPRKELMSYYSSLFDATLNEEPSKDRETVLTTIVYCATELYPEELYDKIKDAYEKGLIDESMLPFEEVVDRMAGGKEAALNRLRETGNYDMVESVIKEMEWWAYSESDDESDDLDETYDLSVEEIMEIFSYDDQVFPRHALRQAVEKKDEIIPHLLMALETATDAPEAVLETVNDSLIYAMFLLAQFREKRAYPLIIKLATRPPELVDALLGDIPTEDLANIFASVSLGDTSLLVELAVNTEAEEFTRAAAIRSWLSLVASGQRSRDEAVAYYKSLFEGGLEDRNEVVWSELVDAANDLFPEEVYDHIKKAYEDGLVDEYIVDPDWVDEQIATGKQEVLAELQEWNHLVQDVTVEMRAWFENREYGDEWDEDEDWHEEDEWNNEDEDEDEEDEGWGDDFWTRSAMNGSHLEGVAPPLRAPEKTGRNEQCPCGSGKKYKKCCGA
ncbi:MAG: DUF1186 domain-containing protein [Chloracidobacterium sp.]|nr:DUF1186 domain-containing protein [Chloracidobacterium sp.]